MNASVVDAFAKVPGLCGNKQRRHMELSPGGDLVETSNTKGTSYIMTKQQVSLQLQRIRCVDETGGSFVEKVGNGE
jgi:hypothetical protein